MKRFVVISLILIALCALVNLNTNQASAESAPLWREDPTPTPTPDQELEDAKRQTAILEERKKQADALKAEAEAQNAKLKAELQPLGPSTVSVPGGNVSTDQAGFVEVQMLAQAAARNLATRLGKELCGKTVVVNVPAANGSPTPTSVNVATLVVYSNSDIAALSVYRPMMDQLTQLENDFDDREGAVNQTLNDTNPAVVGNAGPGKDFAPALAAPAATLMIKSVAELVNLFRSDTQFQNKTVAITDDMVMSYVIEALNGSITDSAKEKLTPCAPTAPAVKPSIYYPALFAPNLFTTASSDLLKQLATIGAARTTAASNIKLIDDRITLINAIQAKRDKVKANKKDRAAKDKELTDLGGDKCKSEKCKKLREEIAELTKQIGADQGSVDQQTGNNEARFDRDYKGWLTDLSKLKPLVQALIDTADKLSTTLNTPDSTNRQTALGALLGAERLKAILEKNTSFTLRASITANGTTKIKKNLFVDAKVRHSAGADLMYQLFDYNGAVALAGVTRCYIDYKSAQQVRQATAQEPIKCTDQPK